MAQLMNVRLSRVDAQPWGLRLQGGKDFGTPLVVQKVNHGSIADQAGLQPGDSVIAVNNVDCFSLRHKDAQDLIVRSGNSFELTIQRGGSTWKPLITPTGSLPSPAQQYGGPVTKTSLLHHPPPNEQHIGSGYNNAARPFNQNGNVKSIVNKQYNTPVGMYSEESIAETLTAQAEVLANGVLGVNFKKNEKAYNSAGSEVLKALKESENDPQEPAATNFFWTASHAIGTYSSVTSRTNTPNLPPSVQQQKHQQHQALDQHEKLNRNVRIKDECIGTSLQQNTLAPDAAHKPSLPPMTTDTLKAPIVQTNITESAIQDVGSDGCAKTVQPCDECGTSMIGVFVRIKDKNLHVDCFKCATCGTSLKNQGYFNLNNKLYCDVHAKLAAVQSPPHGTEGYRPSLIQPNSKLGASTISTALASHQNGNIKSNLGGPRPFGGMVPNAGPRSPANLPSWTKPKPTPPYGNNYGSNTLPKTNFGQNGPGRYNTDYRRTNYNHQVDNQNDIQYKSHQQFNAISEIESIDETTCPSTSIFSWPPPPSEDGQRNTPTASILYIPPPGTQRVQVKSCTQIEDSQLQISQITNNDLNDAMQNQRLQLTSNNLKEHNELNENYSDSYTSTCTTTTTTSEEYQRMYRAQLASAQSQIYYDQSHSDLNSSNCDYEVLSIQQQGGSFSSASTDLMLFSGRRSAHECSDSIHSNIYTSQLVDFIKDNVPSDEMNISSLPPSQHARPLKKVEFSENLSKFDNDNVGKSEANIVNAFKLEPNISADSKVHLSSYSRQILNSTPKEWTSLMCQALTTASGKPFSITNASETVIDCKSNSDNVHSIPNENFVSMKIELVQNVAPVVEEAEQSNDKNEIEAKCDLSPSKKKSFLETFRAVTNEDSMEWFNPNYDSIPLPEETTPYFPPDTPMQPIEKREPLRTKSPFVEALTIAPVRPFTPFENDVITQFEDLPKPEKGTNLCEALTTAPTEPVNKLNPDLPDETEFERIARLEREDIDRRAAEVREQILKTIDNELSKKCTTFGPLTGYKKVDPFKSIQSHAHNNNNQSRSSSICAGNSNNLDQSNASISVNDQTQHIITEHDSNQLNKACSNRKDSNRSTSSSIAQRSTAFPPPSGIPVKSYVQSGLQSPKTIPKYQRQWFNLPSQSPIRTPEPAELRDNVPIAFYDGIPHEKSDTISKPLAVTISASSQSKNLASESVTSTSQTFGMNQQYTSTLESSISSESAASVTTIVPALPENRTGPITYSFQTIDPKTIIDPIRSSTPSLINRPPPMIPYYQQNLVYDFYDAPNAQLYDPRHGTPSPRPDLCKSPAPGPPPNVMKIQAPRIKTPEHFDLNSLSVQNRDVQLLSASKKGLQSSSQSIVNRPETFHREQIGDMQVETHTTGSQLNKANKSDMQYKSTIQIGNAQIQRNRRVVEEFEHTQKSSATEIYRSSANQTQQKFGNANQSTQIDEYRNDIPYGKGFVARQARRLSEVSLQGNKNTITSYCFPQTITGTTESGFPISDGGITINDPPREQTYHIRQKTSFPPPIDMNAFASKHNVTETSLQMKQFQSTALTSASASSSFQTLTQVPSAFLPNPNILNSFKPNSTIQPGSQPSKFTNQCTVSVSDPTPASAGSTNKNNSNIGATSTPKRGQGVLNASVAAGGRVPKCGCCSAQIRGPFITALGRIWCPEHFVCVNGSCRRPLQDIGFVEEKGDLYCEYCFEKFLAPPCGKCSGKIKGDCLNAIGKQWHPECFNCNSCGKLFGNTPFFLEDGCPYCQLCWNDLFTTKCFACGFPVEAGDRWVEALSHNYHSQCFNCTVCKKNLEGLQFYAKADRPYCKNHAR